MTVLLDDALKSEIDRAMAMGASVRLETNTVPAVAGLRWSAVISSGPGDITIVARDNSPGAAVARAVSMLEHDRKQS